MFLAHHIQHNSPMESLGRILNNPLEGSSNATDGSSSIGTEVEKDFIKDGQNLDYWMLFIASVI